MIIPQIITAIFIFVMIFFTLFYYKKKDLNGTSLIIWMFVWIISLILVAFPTTVNLIMQSMNITRVADVFLFFGFMFFAVIIFFLYSSVYKQQKRMEELGRAFAIKNAKKKHK